MKHYEYKTSGTCSRGITFDTEDNKVYNVKFIMGCPGNTHGISAIVDGMDIDTVIKKFENIDCGGRGTSCPAQLARALKEAKE